MRPPIQVARAADGAAIPCLSIGAGDAIVQMPAPPFTHLEIEWSNPAFRRWFTSLSRGHRVVRYDQRGSGLAQHLPATFSLEEQLADLLTVTDHLGLSRFALYAQFAGASTALVFAALYPERVSHLVIAHPTLSDDMTQSPQVRAIRSLLTEDWDLFVETTARARAGWSSQLASQLSDLMRSSISQQSLLTLLETVAEVDLAPYLERISTPTLILYSPPSEDAAVSEEGRTKFFDAPIELTSRVPAAELALIAADGAPPYFGDIDEVTDVIHAFIRERGRPVAPGGLSEREMEVLQLLALGQSNRDIADRLVVSLSTVKSHIQSVYTKLEVHSRTQAIVQARERGLLR